MAERVGHIGLKYEYFEINAFLMRVRINVMLFEFKSPPKINFITKIYLGSLRHLKSRCFTRQLRWLAN